MSEVENREEPKKVVLEHKAVSGIDFMPYGWCGACEICEAMPCKNVCEACSYTETYDLRMPAYWPCMVEKNRLEKLEYARIYALKEAERERIRETYGPGPRDLPDPRAVER